MSSTNICTHVHWLIIVMLCFCTNITHSIILSGQSKVIDNNFVNLTINTNTNLVYIQLISYVSTTLRWNGFGFDSTEMAGTYTIIMDYLFPNQLPIVFETTLANHDTGTIYTNPEITILSDINNGITRTINLQRPTLGTFSFPKKPTTINIISAIGQQSNFPQCISQRQSNCQHIPQNGRLITPLVLTQLTSKTQQPTETPNTKPNTNPANLPTIIPSISPINHPTTNPTDYPTCLPTINPTNSPTNNPTINPTTSFIPTETPINAPVFTRHELFTSKSPTDTKPPTITETYPETLTLSPTFTTTITSTLIETANPTSTVAKHEGHIICDEYNKCLNDDIICIGSDCQIICDSDNSCQLKNIYGIKADSLTIECNGKYSCKNTNIFGGNLLYLIIKCNGKYACKNTNFYGNDTNLLNIYCQNINGSCENMKVFCPLDNKQCIISNNGIKGNDIHTNLQFYAIHGFDDLDIEKYSATLVYTENNYSNMMHCGNDYRTVCKLNSSLLCDCNYHNITVTVDYFQIAGFVVILCVIMVIIIGIIGLCMFCMHSKCNERIIIQHKPYKTIGKARTDSICIGTVDNNIQHIEVDRNDSDDNDTDNDKTHLYPLNTSQPNICIAIDRNR
eukprot:76204_1